MKIYRLINRLLAAAVFVGCTCPAMCQESQTQPLSSKNNDALDSSAFWLTYARAQIASDAVMQSQRIGRATTGALTGKQDAFEQLESASVQLNQDLELLSSGGPYRGRVVPAASPPERVILERAKQNWGNSARAAVVILERKSNLDNFYATLKKLNSRLPPLLETSEQVVVLNVINVPSPRELSATSMLPMLCVRLSRSLNLFFGGENIDPETAFLLGKDANTFHDIVNGFLNGNQALHLQKTRNNDIRVKLSALQSSFDDYRVGIKSILDDLKNLIALKQAAAIIVSENENVKNSLLVLQENYQKVLDTN